MHRPVHASANLHMQTKLRLLQTRKPRGPNYPRGGWVGGGPDEVLGIGCRHSGRGHRGQRGYRMNTGFARARLVPCTHRYRGQIIPRKLANFRALDGRSNYWRLALITPSIRSAESLHTHRPHAAGLMLTRPVSQVEAEDGGRDAVAPGLTDAGQSRLDAVSASLFNGKASMRL